MRTRSILRPLAISALLALPVAAQQTSPSIAPSADQLSEALLVSDWTTQALDLPMHAGSPFSVEVVFGGEPMELLLWPHSVRADDFQLLVDDGSGELVEVVPGPPTTYQGIVKGLPDSLVAGSLVEGQLSAMVRIDADMPLFGIQPASELDATASRESHFVYDGGDAIATDVSCGFDETAVRTIDGEPSPPGGFSDGGGSDKVCEIACDADFDFYDSNGESVTQTENDIENIINGCDSIYKGDVGVQYEITTIIVRTSESSESYDTSSPSGLLNTFESVWASNHQNVDRDVAHLFTGINLSGSTIGIANINAICSQSNGFGLSQSKYTSNMTNRIGLTAHELGHNWNAYHCNGDNDCKIMCSGLGGCAGSVTSFGTTSTNAITNKKNSVGCLHNAIPPAPPTITSINPGNVEAFLGGPITINGTSFEEVQNIQIGGQNMQHGEGYSVESVTEIVIDAPPTPTALGPVSVTVTNSGGTSPASSLTWVETDPPRLVSSSLILQNQTHTWSYAGGANDFAWLVISITGVTVPFDGQTLLLPGFIVSAAPLDAAGLGEVSLNIPAVGQLLFVYSQAITLDGSDVKTSEIVLGITGG